MTPDISAIAKKHANTYAGRDEADPLGLEEHGLAQRIRFAILEATASLRAQLEQSEAASELWRKERTALGKELLAAAGLPTEFEKYGISHAIGILRGNTTLADLEITVSSGAPAAASPPIWNAHPSSELTPTPSAQLEELRAEMNAEIGKSNELGQEWMAKAKAAEQRWIPVSEKLPEDDKPVWALLDDTHSFEGICAAGEWYGYDIVREDTFAIAETRDKVTHWRELPAAPRVAQESPLNGKEGE